jgi:hypothetical protein
VNAVSSLAKYYSANLVGFFSYSREDDVDFNEVLSKFRNAIQAELSAQLGRNREGWDSALSPSSYLVIRIGAVTGVTQKDAADHAEFNASTLCRCAASRLTT